MSAYARKLHNKWGITDCRQREQEDEEACKVLACKRRSMPFKDAIYRQAPDGHFLYDTSDSLFEDMCSEDGALLEKLLEIFLGEYKAGDTYYFPMAKGGHVDHRIVNLAGMELVKRGCIVIFYKEFFYKSSVDAAESCSIYEFSEATLVKKIEAMRNTSRSCRFCIKSRWRNNFERNWQRKIWIYRLANILKCIKAIVDWNLWCCGGYLWKRRDC